MKLTAILFALSTLLVQSLGAQKTSAQDELYAAINKDDPAAIKTAVKKGANPNEKSLLANTATRKCFDPGVNAMNPDEYEELGHSCLKSIKALVESGADVNAAKSGGWTALMAAADQEHLDIVTYLVSQRTRIDAKTRQGRTALIRSAYHGRAKVIAYLISKGADVNAPDADGVTALMLAAQNGHHETIKVLLAAGADKTPVNANKKTALMLAENGYEAYARQAKAEGENVAKRPGANKSLWEFYKTKTENFRRSVALLKSSEKPGARLIIRGGNREIKAVVTESLHTKLKAKAEKQGAEKGDAVYLAQ